MSADGNDSVTMIGLHTLESLADGGMLPQLQALASRPRNQWTFWNVVEFPRHLTRVSGSLSGIELGSDAESGANIIDFRMPSSRL